MKIETVEAYKCDYCKKLYQRKWFCEKRDCFIHPPSVAAKGNAFDMGNKSNEEMPKQCEFYIGQDFK
jgi:hypothetical protein